MPRRSDFHAFIDEDVGRGDITSELVVKRGQRARARVVARQACVVAGLEEAKVVFEELGLEVRLKANDGDRVRRGEVVAVVRGKARSILKGERLALNFIQRMSGIATLTRRTVEAGRKANPRLVVAATRKTTPGFRAFEKRAVVLGGGDPHRHALDDMVLVKDNHLALAGGVEGAMARVRGARGATFTKKVEVEASTLKDALRAAQLGADVVMLDNFPRRGLAEAYRAIKAQHPHVLVEVSGRIDASNIARVAPHADIVSCGALTHSADACDFALDVEPER